MDVDERVEALLNSPLGCAFLFLADATGRSPNEIVEPAFSLYLCAFAGNAVEVWRGDYQQVRTEYLQQGPQHSDLARALLEEPGAAWWFGPLERDNQICVPRDGSLPDPACMVTPAQPPSSWEQYAQKVFGGLYTSTFKQGTSSILASLYYSTCDITVAYPGPPFAAWRLKADSTARIFEINGPLAWHDLCLRYPAEKRGEPSHPDFSGDEGQLVPDWSAVAADWDAVHLSFGGLLTADRVRVESPEGWTYHWGWDAEMTLWLRWMFTISEHIPDHEPITPLSDLHGFY
jgi:hypothetical protein